MKKTLIYYNNKYENTAKMLLDNYIRHNHHAEIMCMSVEDHIDFAKKQGFEDAMFIESDESIIHSYIESGRTSEVKIRDLLYSSPNKNIKLVKLTYEYRKQLSEMVEEWKKDIEENRTNHSPWVIFKNDFHDFDYYIKNLEIKEEIVNGPVPDTTLFCLDLDRNIFVGAVNIRHYLNESLLRTGGHIGYGIRPSERRKGYATAMIALALEECGKFGIERVLMCCNKDNIGSAKSIIYNGGVLENEIVEDGCIEQRYWIQL